MIKQRTAHYECIDFSSESGIPHIDVAMTACRFTPEHFYYDEIDLRKKTTRRWTLPFLTVEPALNAIRNACSRDKLPYRETHEQYYKSLMTPHVAQKARNGRLFVCLVSGVCAFAIDTKTHQVDLFPGTYHEDLMLYSATGDLSEDGRSWYFVRWPLSDTLDILNHLKENARCEIGKVDVDTLDYTLIYSLDNHDTIHQVTASPDERYLVFTTFKSELNVPYPLRPYDQDPDGFRKSHQGGLKTETMVTVDTLNNRHWRTEIPVPVPAHFEFDPADPRVFYVSAHNMSWAGSSSNVVLEGPATLFRMEIRDGRTDITGAYTHPQFFRITQHMPFVFKGRTLIAVTSIPNWLEIIDAATMTLWRRITLFDTPMPDLSWTGNAMCPKHPEMCLSVNPSFDGAYVVLESHKLFRIYDVERDRLLDAVIPAFLSDGSGRVGHTRTVGQ